MEEGSATPLSLAEEFGKLLQKRDLVLKRVEKAKERNETVTGVAKEWLDEVEKLIQEMNKGKNKGVISPSAQYSFSSMKDASKKLLEALQEDSYILIALYGKRGVGKTTLAKSQISNYEKIFSRVIYLDAFKKELRDIYEDMANSLHLNFKFEKDDYHLKQGYLVDSKRQEKIKSELEREDVTTLVILDNFPTVSSLSYLGIPDQCKVLLIIDDDDDCKWHYKKIRQQQLDCDHSVHLEPMSNDEAWELVQRFIGIDTRAGRSDDDLFNVAREVAFRCKGLPGLIKDVVSSLHYKNTVERWTETLVNLQHSTASYQIFIGSNVDCQQLLYSMNDVFSKEGFKVYRSSNISNFSRKEADASVKAIEQSMCTIIVFSENYSRYYKGLIELVKIVSCMEETKQLIFPIFNDVDPSDVKHVRGRFKDGLQNAMKEAISDMGEKCPPREDMMKQWTSALYQIGSLPGKQYEGPRSKFMKEVVQHFQNIKHRLHVNGRDGRLCSYMKSCKG